ncbi:MAG: ABC transporter permease [Pyrinomonadaceae bacterium]
MESLFKDIRYGIRNLLKHPTFAATALITLAIGIGANTTIFSFVNGILLRPLPYPQSERLVMINETALKQGVSSMSTSFPNFLDWRAQNRVFEDIASFSDGSNFSLTGIGEPERLRGADVSQGTFELLRVAPVLGRTFTAEEDKPKQDAVVILGYALWQRRFGSDSQIIGKPITVNSRQRTVVGVMPPGFKFPETAELWVPLGLDTTMFTRTDHGLGTIARLKDGVSLAQAQAEMDVIARRIEEQNPVTNEGLGVSISSLHTVLAGDYSKALLILLGVVGFVLLVACANVANLMLARTSARQKEFAVRAALGASRWRIVRQILTESLLLSLLGSGLGLLLAMWGVKLMLALIPVKLPFWMNFNLDPRVLAFTTGVSLLTALIFGTMPAVLGTRIDLNNTLKEGGRSGGASARHRTRGLLVITEVALALMVLVGAGLMIQSFLNLRHFGPGFSEKNVLTFSVSLPRAKYKEEPQRGEFFRQLLERVRALPGVDSAAATTTLPLKGGNWGRSLTVEGYPVLSVGQAPMIQHTVVTPGYFHTMGIPILKGRDFTDRDSKDAEKVTIVDERLAHDYWPTESPIGKRVRFGPPEDNEPWHTVVGVVGAVRHQQLDTDTRKSVYLPHLQIPVNGLALVVQSKNPFSLVGALRGQIREMDPDLPVVELMMMEEVVSQSVWQNRLYAILFSVFAAIAMLLAAVGIYGVMSYSVTQRTQEIGIRMALGAQLKDVLQLVVKGGLALSLIGVAIGIAGALALTRLLRTLLFGITPTDAVTLIAVSLMLLFVALLACYIPARRATKVDPLVALRYE